MARRILDIAVIALLAADLSFIVVPLPVSMFRHQSFTVFYIFASPQFAVPAAGVAVGVCLWFHSRWPGTGGLGVALAAGAGYLLGAVTATYVWSMAIGWIMKDWQF